MTAKGQKAPTEAELKKQCETQYKSLQQEVLGFLTSSAWVLGEAKSLGVKLSDNEVRNQFLKIKHQQFKKPAEFEKFLATSGQSVSDLLLRVKLNMLSQKIQAKIVKEKPKVSQAEIQKYYNENKSRYGTPEKRDAQIILTKTEEQAKEAKKELESGKSFSEVAKKHSIDPTSKAKGGQLGEVVKGQDDQSLDNAMFAAKANELGGPVKSPFGYYLYEVKSIKPGNSQPLSKVEASIKQTLTTQAQQKKLSNFIKNFKKKWQAKTDCQSGYVVANCKQYKAPKTSTATPGGRDEHRRLTPAPTPGSDTPRRGTRERDRAGPRPSDPRQSRQPDGRGGRAPRLGCVRTRRRPLRAPRPASSRPPSCATAVRHGAARASRARSRTSTGRSRALSAASTQTTRRASTAP